MSPIIYIGVLFLILIALSLAVWKWRKTVTEVVFVCDESGAKGLGDKAEQGPKQIGLVAGVIVPKEKEFEVRNAMDNIAKQYPVLQGEKLHITSLSQADANALRNDVFQLITSKGLHCAYEAIAAQGLHESHLTQEAAQVATDNAVPEGVYKLPGNPRHQPERSHTEQFVGCFGKVLAHCSDQSSQESAIKIEIVTDNVEDAILDEFRKGMGELTGTLPDMIENHRYYDRNQGQPLGRQIAVSLDLPYGFADEFSNTTFDVNCEESSFTLLADVLANSLLDHIQKRFRARTVADINSTKATEGHPLHDNIVSRYPEGQGIGFSDNIHRHPDV